MRLFIWLKPQGKALALNDATSRLRCLSRDNKGNNRQQFIQSSYPTPLSFSMSADQKSAGPAICKSNRDPRVPVKACEHNRFNIFPGTWKWFFDLKSGKYVYCVVKAMHVSDTHVEHVNDQRV